MQKQLKITVAVLYGYSGASGKTADYQKNERLISAALRRARHFKDIPYILGGDFNITPESSRAISLARSAGWITDLAEAWTKPGEEPPTTYRLGSVEQGMQGSGTTRIDAIFPNEIAKHLISHFDHAWDLATGYDHVPLRIKISIKAFTQSIHAVQKPTEINIDEYDPKLHTEAIKQQLWDEVWQDAQPQFAAMLDEQNIQGAHEIWCKAAETMLQKLLHANINTKCKYVRGQLQSLKAQSMTRNNHNTLSSIRNVASQIAVRAIGKCRHLIAKCKHWCIAHFRSADSAGDQVQFWNSDTSDTEMWNQVQEDLDNELLNIQNQSDEQAVLQEDAWQQSPTIEFMQTQAD